jgi:hypothetical protein
MHFAAAGSVGRPFPLSGFGFIAVALGLDLRSPFSRMSFSDGDVCFLVTMPPVHADSFALPLRLWE